MGLKLSVLSYIILCTAAVRCTPPMCVLRLCDVHILCVYCGCAMYTSYVCTAAVRCTPPMCVLRLCDVHLLCVYCSCAMYTSYVCTAAVRCTPPMCVKWGAVKPLALHGNHYWEFHGPPMYLNATSTPL